MICCRRDTFQARACVRIVEQIRRWRKGRRKSRSFRHLNQQSQSRTNFHFKTEPALIHARHFTDSFYHSSCFEYPASMCNSGGVSLTSSTCRFCKSILPIVQTLSKSFELMVSVRPPSEVQAKQKHRGADERYLIGCRPCYRDY